MAGHDVKVTELPLKAAPLDADILMLVDIAGGTVSKQMTKAELLALLQAEVDLNTAKVSADGLVTTHSDMIDAGSGSVITGLERTKLGGIEPLADVNQTDAEIKAQYETNADTNPFTDADQSTLAAAITQVNDDPAPILGGNLQLNSNMFVINVVAGETIAVGQMVYLDPAVDKALLTSASVAAKSRGFYAVALEARVLDQPLLVGWLGQSSLFTGLSIGTGYYLSAVPGGITATPPSGGDTVRLVGYALSATTLSIMQNLTFIETQ